MSHLAGGGRRPGTGGRTPGYLLAAAVLALASGCGFFDLRDPIEPQNPVVVPSKPWNSADNVRFDLTVDKPGKEW